MGMETPRPKKNMALQENHNVLGLSTSLSNKSPGRSLNVDFSLSF